MNTQQHSLPLRRLGKTGLEVTALSLGGAGFGGVYGTVGDQDSGFSEVFHLDRHPA